MEKYIYNEQNGLHYELVGDYYLPLLTVPEMPPIGVWGRRRQRYLKEHRPVLYNTILLSGKLFPHLAEVDQQAKELHDRLIKQMAAQAGINEQLKEQDQMAWVQQMNAIDAQVREIINHDLIYAGEGMPV